MCCREDFHSLSVANKSTFKLLDCNAVRICSSILHSMVLFIGVNSEIVAKLFLSCETCELNCTAVWNDNSPMIQKLFENDLLFIYFNSEKCLIT